MGAPLRGSDPEDWELAVRKNIRLLSMLSGTPMSADRRGS
jgi:hypothetical protein